MLASVPSTGVDGDKERMGGREALSCHEITPPPNQLNFEVRKWGIAHHHILEAIGMV